MLLVSSFGFTSVYAIDLSDYGLGSNIGQSVRCVIVVVGCDGTGSASSSGNTIIGSYNSNDIGNDESNSGGVAETQSGTLMVSKEIICKSINGTPIDKAVCGFAKSSSNYPQVQDFSFTVSGNNPNPSISFPASTLGTPVTIGPGTYTIVEGLSNGFDIGQLHSELNALSVTLDGTGVKGDCDFIDHVTASGSMTLGEPEECTFINTITFNFGTVPETNS